MNEKKVEIEFLDEGAKKREERLENRFYSDIAFYFSLFSLVLFSWLFQIMVWEVIKIKTTTLLSLYMIVFIGFPIIGLIMGIIARKLRKSKIGIVINSLVLLSYLISFIVWLSIN